MTYQAEFVLGKDVARRLVEAYRKDFESADPHLANDLPAFFYKDMIELGVKIGLEVSRHYPARFVEIGCGSFPVPTLTLVKLGHAEFEAFDYDSVTLARAVLLTHDLGVMEHPAPYFLHRDFYDWNPDLEPGTFLIAQQPRSRRYHSFEEDIVGFAIAKGVNLALMPYPEGDFDGRDMARRAEKYAQDLQKAGYETRVHHLLKNLPESKLVVAVRTTETT